MAPVLRLDFGRLAKAQPIAGGGIRVPAHLTRTGIFRYRNTDGSERRELRLPEEVFAPQSLATLPYAPVTDLHPNGMVRTDNWREHGVGVVAENVQRAAGDYVAADLVVQDAAVIAAIERGDRAEVSCGYHCDLEDQPGTFNGEAYDVVQRNIRYNHVALGPRGWARAGAGASLRLDGGAIQHSPGDDAGNRSNTAMAVFKIDGKDYEMSAEAYQLMVDMGGKAKARIDTLTAEGAALKSERDRLQGLVDTHKPVDVDALVAKRLDTRARAIKLVGTEFRFDGMADRDVMIAAIKVAKKDFNADGKSDDYVVGVFESCLEGHSSLHKDGDKPPPPPKDGEITGDGSAYRKARTDAHNALSSAWMMGAQESK